MGTEVDPFEALVAAQLVDAARSLQQVTGGEWAEMATPFNTDPDDGPS